MIKFSGLQDAFFFVGSESYGMHRAILDKETGKIHYKSELHSKGLLQDWYEYENRREEKALREWCEDNGIEVSD